MAVLLQFLCNSFLGRAGQCHSLKTLTKVGESAVQLHGTELNDIELLSSSACLTIAASHVPHLPTPHPALVESQFRLLKPEGKAE